MILKLNAFIALFWLPPRDLSAMGAQDVLYPYCKTEQAILGGLAMTSFRSGSDAGKINFRHRRSAAYATTLITAVLQKRAMGAGDHRAYRSWPGNVFEVASVLPSPVLRLWPHRDRAIAVASGFQWSPPYPLRTVFLPPHSGPTAIGD